MQPNTVGAVIEPLILCLHKSQDYGTIVDLLSTCKAARQYYSASRTPYYTLAISLGRGLVLNFGIHKAGIVHVVAHTISAVPHPRAIGLEHIAVPALGCGAEACRVPKNWRNISLLHFGAGSRLKTLGTIDKVYIKPRTIRTAHGPEGRHAPELSDTLRLSNIGIESPNNHDSEHFNAYHRWIPRAAVPALSSVAYNNICWRRDDIPFGTITAMLTQIFGCTNARLFMFGLVGAYNMRENIYYCTESQLYYFNHIELRDGARLFEDQEFTPVNGYSAQRWPYIPH
jgi:hypothetical protein